MFARILGLGFGSSGAGGGGWIGGPPMSAPTAPAEPAAETMTAPEYAVHRGVSDSYVRRMRRKGNLVMTGDGRIDVRASDDLLDGLTHPLRGGKRPGSGRPPAVREACGGDVAAPAEAGGDGGAGSGGAGPAGRHSAGDQPAAPPAPGATISVHEAVRRERLARARMAELELGEQARALVRTEQVQRAVFTLVRQALNQLQGMSGRLARSLAAETDPFRAGEILDAEVANICTEMRAAAASLLAPGAGGVDADDDEGADIDSDADTETEALDA